jgi:hypothetical protein
MTAFCSALLCSTVGPWAIKEWRTDSRYSCAPLWRYHPRGLTVNCQLVVFRSAPFSRRNLTNSSSCSRENVGFGTAVLPPTTTPRGVSRRECCVVCKLRTSSTNNGFSKYRASETMISRHGSLVISSVMASVCIQAPFFLLLSNPSSVSLAFSPYTRR